ncbi:penicillin-binding transpeptidase domain-containing protein [Glycomyces buryatensis]|uniref:Penicillin-binding protein 2 n=1 Tax=Glycomyces buryatensis TaxID=2570927 RepID=A0A4V4HQI3_9ACTN|nr:penicillin-binding transpeptidase domain-containing protein [Glycomyces buryatensis]THV33926.1 penicillin-binding protein 2 [Glycomyces buryatensis]
MNPSLRRTGLIALILLGALLVQVTWVQFFHHDDYDALSAGRTVITEYEVPRGEILAGDVPWAFSVETDEESTYDYERAYAEGNYFANLTGYKSMQYGATGIEAAENELLNGTSSLLAFDDVLGTISGESKPGGNVVLTVDDDLQRAAYDALAETGVKGGAVVIDPKTGQILAQATHPGWNPAGVSSNSSETREEAWAEVNNDDNPAQDRTRSDFYPPGSTFKTIVASAFIENGLGDADTMVPAGNSYTAPNTDHVITNSSDQCPNAQYTLKEAFAKSCNTTFAALCAEDDFLTQEQIADMADAYGFGEAFETPLNSVASQTGDLSEDAFRAQACIGQQEVRETVLQNTIIAGTIANGGERMDPQLIAELTDSEGNTLQRGDEDSAGDSISSGTADEMQKLMESVVTDGTGSASAVDGYTVGGKTGTAEHSADADGSEADHGWFHGWAMDEDGEPAVAVCVFLESYGEQASATAAGIAGDLMEQVLEGKSEE